MGCNECQSNANATLVEAMRSERSDRRLRVEMHGETVLFTKELQEQDGCSVLVEPRGVHLGIPDVGK
eukprot:520482-Pyramimonas_sp.AAC.1